MSNSKWFSWQELLDRWGLKDYELVERFKDGLQPYRRHGRGCILNSDDYHVYMSHFERHGQITNSLRNLSVERLKDREESEDELATITKEMEAIADEDLDLCSWKYLDMHLSSEQTDKLISTLKKEQPLFERNNVLEIERKCTDQGREKTKKLDMAVLNGVSVNDKIINKDNVFCCWGTNWIIKFNGKDTTLPDHEKFRYIIHLLQNPRESIHVLDLVAAVKGTDLSEATKTYTRKTEEQLEEDGVSLSKLEIETLSDEDKKAIEDQAYTIVGRLENTKKRGEQVQIKIAESDLKKYRRYMLNEYAIKTFVSSKGITFKKLSRSGSEAEKARQNVKNQIDNAIHDIDEKLPALSSYLRNHIHKGLRCTYKPDLDNPIDWHISW